MVDYKLCTLGIELGSTRIKAVLINEKGECLAVGIFDWENKLCDGVWTYSLDEAVNGVSSAYALLAEQYKEKYGEELCRIDAVGISAMMHGYLAFDSEDRLLVPFRTWRNTITEKAASYLTELFSFNIPQRWSIAHYGEAILNKEEHVSKVAHLTTLAGYIHYVLTGERVLGVGDASGMFPIDKKGCDYDRSMCEKFDAFAASRGINCDIYSALPKVLTAGQPAGRLTERGASLLDKSGKLKAGIPFAPPEGDAGTGMVATDSVRALTGNISAGTSVFSMTVLEKPLSKVYREIDVVTTPDGAPVAMVHCNTCTSDIDAWVGVFADFAARLGIQAKKSEIYDALYLSALESAPECEGVLSYNFYSGEPVISLGDALPMYIRNPGVPFSLSSFMRSQLYACVAALRLGNDILTKEGVKPLGMLGHGGIFKTEGVASKIMASALKIPVSVMKTAGEGGPWGMALLALYMLCGSGVALPDFLDTKIFASSEKTTYMPDEKESDGFDRYLEKYVDCLEAVKVAAERY